MVRREYRDPEERLERAIDAFFDGQIEHARTELKALEAMGYRCAELYLYLGHCALADEKLARALRHYRESRHRGPEQPDVYIGLAVVAARRLHFRRAIKLLRKAIRLRYDLAEAFDNLILCHGAVGELDAAMEAFTASVKLDAKSPHPYFNAGYLQFDHGHHAQAKHLWLEVLRRAPDYPDVARLVACCDRAAGNLEAARRRLEKTKRRLPRDVDVRAELGMVHEDRDEWQSALKEYEAALEIDPSHARVRARLGILLVRNGRQDDGALHLDRAATETPGDPDVVEPFAYWLVESGRADDACRVMRAPVLHDRECPMARVARARVHTMTGRFGRAAAGYATASRLDPDDPSYAREWASSLIAGRAFERAESVILAALARFGPDPELYELWGRLALGRGDPDGATMRLRAGLAALPGEPKLTVKLADAYLSSGRASRAIVTARRVATEGFAAERADVLGRAFLALGRTERALEAASRLMELNPNDPRGVCLRGRAVLEGGDAQRALSDLRCYVRARPGDPEGYRWLARGLAELGENEAADAQDRIRRFVEGSSVETQS